MIEYRNNFLYIDGVNIKEAAKDLITPFYVYSSGELEKALGVFKEAFDFCEVAYSLKANSNTKILKFFKEKGLAADVVSGWEMLLALEIGFEPQQIYFNGNGKTKHELILALEKGVKIHVDSVEELLLLKELAQKKDLKIGVRINPQVQPETHPHIKTGHHESKFGVPIDLFEKFLEELKKTPFILAGLHFHVGSQIMEATPYLEALKKIRPFIKDLKNLGLEYIDIGGGMGIKYSLDEETDLKKMAEKIKKELSQPEFEGLKIVAEPGRFLVAKSGVIISRVVHIKKAHRNFVVIDAGMNDLIRPAMYGAFHPILPVEIKNKKMKADIVGPVCESSDIFAEDVEIPQVEKDDLMAVFFCGAYSYVMASNYNLRPRAAQFWAENGKLEMITRRETLNDMLNLEVKLWSL